MKDYIQQEADRRYEPDHEVDDPFGETGVARSDPYGYDELANRVFVEAAKWGRLNGLREAAAIVDGKGLICARNAEPYWEGWDDGINSAAQAIVVAVATEPGEEAP